MIAMFALLQPQRVIHAVTTKLQNVERMKGIATKIAIANPVSSVEGIIAQMVSQMTMTAAINHQMSNAKTSFANVIFINVKVTARGVMLVGWLKNARKHARSVQVADQDFFATKSRLFNYDLFLNPIYFVDTPLLFSKCISFSSLLFLTTNVHDCLRLWFEYFMYILRAMDDSVWKLIVIPNEKN